jgi:ribulose-bisphosphate carboxylase small chain
MRLTQGTFSFLPDLTDAQIRKQVEYCLGMGFPINIEYTDDPHPRNSFWEMWGLPLFDLRDPVPVLAEIEACRRAYPDHYVKVNGYDVRKGRETVALSFIVQRPKDEPGFRLERHEVRGRTINYALHSYATERPEGERYGRRHRGEWDGGQ